jgi:hypothetical protein
MLEKDHIMDKRIIKRNIDRGRLTPKQYQVHLASLPDVDSKATVQTVEIRSGEFELLIPEPVEE